MPCLDGPYAVPAEDDKRVSQRIHPYDSAHAGDDNSTTVCIGQRVVVLVRGVGCLVALAILLWSVHDLGEHEVVIELVVQHPCVPRPTGEPRDSLPAIRVLCSGGAVQRDTRGGGAISDLTQLLVLIYPALELTVRGAVPIKLDSSATSP